MTARDSGITFRRGVFTALALSLAACDGSYYVAPQRTCPPAITIAIRLDVRDSVTGAGAALGATVSAHYSGTAGTYTLPDITGTDTLRILVGTQPGTYDLTIKRSGYATWTRNGIVVEADPLGCAPKTVALTARLQPAP